MGLLTQEVEIGLSGTNLKHYEDLGYEIPRYINNRQEIKRVKNGTKIKVNVNDLLNGSDVKVDIQCDNCKKILNNVFWINYKKYVKEDGKYYCKNCAVKLFGTEKMRLTKLENSKSFEYWCIDNNKKDVLDRWDYELNNCKPQDICYGSTKRYYFKCPIGIHKSELKTIGYFTTGQEGSIKCNQCNSFAQYGIDNICEDFLDKYWDYEKNELNPWKIAHCSNKKVWIKCQEKDYHGSYDIVCSSFTKRNTRCSFCTSRKNKVHKFDSIGYLYPQVLEIWSDKNKKPAYEYSPGSNQKVWWKCPEGKHEDYKRIICSSNYLNFSCSECSKERKESFLQEKVRLYLNKLGYTVLHENNCTLKCTNPKTKMPLPYDNEVKELKLIIEVMGKQHEKICTWHKSLAKKNNTTPEYELCYQKLKDRYKRIFAKSQGFFIWRFSIIIMMKKKLGDI